MGEKEEGQGPRRSWRLVAFALIALSLGFAASLILAEIAVRVFWTHRVRTPFALDDERYLYVNEPGVLGSHSFPGQFEYDFSINSRGFRGDEVPLSRTDVALRVLCVGDSFTWGTGAEDEETYPAQLGERLSAMLGREPVEVINAGVMSWGMTQYYRWTLERGMAFEPDVIVIAMFYDDWEQSMLGLVVENEDGELEGREIFFEQLHTQRQMMSWIPGFRWLMTHSQLLNWVRDSLRVQVTWPPGTDDFLVRATDVPDAAAREEQRAARASEAMSITKKMWAELAREADSRGISLVAVAIPEVLSTTAEFEGETDPHPTRTAARAELGAYLQSLDVDFVDFTPVVLSTLRASGKDPEALFYTREGHLRPRGYRLLADTLAPEVLDALGSSAAAPKGAAHPNR